MTNEEIDTLRSLIGSKVIVITKTGETLKGIWKTNLVNTVNTQVRLVLETENCTVSFPIINIKSIEKQ